MSGVPQQLGMTDSRARMKQEQGRHRPNPRWHRTSTEAGQGQQKHHRPNGCVWWAERDPRVEGRSPCRRAPFKGCEMTSQ